MTLLCFVDIFAPLEGSVYFEFRKVNFEKPPTPPTSIVARGGAMGHFHPQA